MNFDDLTIFDGDSSYMDPSCNLSFKQERVEQALCSGKLSVVPPGLS